MPWRAAPPEYGSHKTLYTCSRRWSKAGIFCHILRVLSDMKAETHALMMDSTFSKASCHACSPGLKHVSPEPGSNWTKGSLYETTPAPEDPLERRRIGKTKGGVNSKLHCPGDAGGWPMRFHLTAGQKSDCEGAKALLEDLPPAKVPVANRACDTNKIRDCLKSRKIRRCIPPRRIRKKVIRYDRKICKSCHRIEN